MRRGKRSRRRAPHVSIARQTNAGAGGGEVAHEGASGCAVSGVRTGWITLCFPFSLRAVFLPQLNVGPIA